MFIGLRKDILDHGFVEVVDIMGDDAAVAHAAWISTGKKSTEEKDIRRIIEYLMRHRHTSPFEMCEIKFHIKLPIFVARQWIRHRTANVNEASARYSEMSCEFYTPSVWREQDAKNRQGSDGACDIDQDMQTEVHTHQMVDSIEFYLSMLNSGISRELSRIAIPLAMYTEWYWKIDLHNLLHFLQLRLEDGAQLEIREYAKAIEEMVREYFPICWKAWRKRVLVDRFANKYLYDRSFVYGLSIDDPLVDDLIAIM